MGQEDGRATRPLLSLDIGGTKIGWAVVAGSDELSILDRGSIPTRAADGGAVVAQRIAEFASVKCAEIGARGIGIASAGVINPTNADVVAATETMPGWGGTKLGDILREATGLPVWAVNDVHGHGYGEALLGAGRGFTSVLACAVGTGIGGAHIRDREIVFGDHFVTGHYGHIHHHAAAGQTCSCGREGHIESIASGSGITTWFNSRSDAEQVANGFELQQLADAGHELAIQTFVESAYALGEVLGSLANAVDPSVIVLSGSMTRSGERWWNALREGYRATAMDVVADLEIREGELGSDAPLYGAALNFVRNEESHD